MTRAGMNLSPGESQLLIKLYTAPRVPLQTLVAFVPCEPPEKIAKYEMTKCSLWIRTHNMYVFKTKNEGMVGANLGIHGFCHRILQVTQLGLFNP